MTLVHKRANNTFKHVLYVMHRDSLFASKLKVRYTKEQDFHDYLETLETIENFEDTKS